MHKKFEINRTKIKGGCQSGRKVVTPNSKSDLPLNLYPKCLTTLKAVNLNLLYLEKKRVSFGNASAVPAINIDHRQEAIYEELTPKNFEVNLDYKNTEIFV